MAKTLVGIVSSNKPDKTIIVTVQTAKTHPIYKKKYSVSKKFMAHDEKNEAEVGDKVSIIESRPHSKRKRFVLENIIQKPVLREVQTFDEVEEIVPVKPAQDEPLKAKKSKSDDKEESAA